MFCPKKVQVWINAMKTNPWDVYGWRIVKNEWKFLVYSINFVLKACIKGALDNLNIIPQLFPKKVGIFIPLEVLAWVMTACLVLHSRLIYFVRSMNISSIFYFAKSPSINTQNTSLWDTLQMMLFMKYLVKMKTHWQNRLKISVLFNLKFSRLQKIDVLLVQCPFKKAAMGKKGKKKKKAKKPPKQTNKQNKTKQTKTTTTKKKQKQKKKMMIPPHLYEVLLKKLSVLNMKISNKSRKKWARPKH